MSLLRDLCVDEERLVGLPSPYAQSPSLSNANVEIIIV